MEAEGGENDRQETQETPDNSIRPQGAIHGRGVISSHRVSFRPIFVLGIGNDRTVGPEQYVEVD
ncbi:hypothetical protein GCM10010988_38940 [Cnuibacter physcomitrellae]|nr:hypothetical protein GCM10010988_38940 [Cnuibacter physcomitrellae]